MKGVNLIVDSSFILYKNVYILAKEKTLYGDLESSLEMAYNGYLQKFPFDNVYLVADSKRSWRKKIYPEYKGKRKEAREKQDIDWEFVFNTHDQFKEKIKLNPRIKVLEIDTLEADDIIAYVIQETNKKGFSNVFIASDGDLNQLLDYRTNPLYLNIQWRDTFKTAKVFLPQGHELFISELQKKLGDIFNLNKNDEFLDLYNSFLDKMEKEVIDIEEHVFKKLVEGDSGDNIKSSILVPMKSDPTKKRGIGKAGAKKVYDEYKLNNPGDVDFLSDDWLPTLAHYMTENKKVKLIDYEDEIVESLKLNRTLMHLDLTHFPEYVMEELKKLDI